MNTEDSVDYFALQERVKELEEKLKDSVEVVRCKDCRVVRCRDCRHRDLFSCPLADNDFQKDEDFCSWGERREKSEVEG